MPESTLTPAPVMVATFPGARNAAMRSTAAAGLTVAADVVDEIVRGLVTRASGPTEVLRRRTLTDQLRRLVTDGPVHSRRRP